MPLRPAGTKRRSVYKTQEEWKKFEVEKYFFMEALGVRSQYYTNSQIPLKRPLSNLEKSNIIGCT